MLSALLEAGLALRVRQYKLAARAYVADRAAQGRSAVRSYLLATALFAAAAVFVIAACFVGLLALYRWLALVYGQFIAFGSVAGLLVILALICLGVAVSRLNKQPRDIESLSSRLSAVAEARPLPGGRTVGDVAATSAVAGQRADHRNGRKANGGALLLAALTLLGWAIVRSRRRSGK